MRNTNNLKNMKRNVAFLIAGNEAETETFEMAIKTPDEEIHIIELDLDTAWMMLRELFKYWFAGMDITAVKPDES